VKSRVLTHVRLALVAAAMLATSLAAPAQQPGSRPRRVEAAARPAPAAASSELADDLGDPLPPGAVARLGTVRLRQTMPAFCVAFAHDGNTFATGHGDGSVRIWEVSTGRLVRRIAAHSDVVTALAFPPGGWTIVSGSHDHTIRYWALHDGNEVRRIDAPAPVAALLLAPDRRSLYAAAGRRILAYEPDSGNRLDQLRTEHPCGGAMAALPDRTILALGGRHGSIRLLDFKTRKDLATIACKDRAQTYVAASIDGRTLAWAEPGGKVHLADVATEADRHVLIGHTAGVCCLAFSPDGRLLATRSADHTTRIWSVSTAREVHRFESCGILPNSLAFSPNGRYLAAARVDKAVDLWDLKTGKCVFDLPGHTEQVYALAYSPDGRRLASGAVSSGGRVNNTIRMWDVARRKELWRGPTAHGVGARQIAWHPDGKRFASRGSGKTVRIWDAATGQELRTMPTGKLHVTAMTFEPDANTVLVARADGTISRWRWASGEVREVQTAVRTAAHSMAYSPDGRTLALGHARVDLCDSRELKRLRTLPGGKGVFWNVRFCPDGRRLAAGGQGVTMWDVPRAAKLFTAGATLGTIWCTDLSPGGRLIVSAHADGAVRLWEAATGSPIAALRGHEGPVYAVAFAPDGKTFCSGGQDAQILVWSLAELSGVCEPPSSPAQMQALWRQLADANAAVGFRARQALEAAGSAAVAVLAERLKVPSTPPGDHVRQLIADLGADRYATRNKAMDKLRDLGPLVQSQLEQAREHHVSAEVRQRAQQLLDVIRAPWPPSARELRAIRAVAVLEHVGGENARAALARLAAGPEGLPLADHARAALKRMDKTAR